MNTPIVGRVIPASGQEPVKHVPLFLNRAAAEYRDDCDRLAAQLSASVAQQIKDRAEWMDDKQRLERELAETLDALRDLRDEQNGAPLCRYETQWKAAMDKADEILAKHNK